MLRFILAEMGPVPAADTQIQSQWRGKKELKRLVQAHLNLGLDPEPFDLSCKPPAGFE